MTECPDLVNGRIRMCDSPVFDGMVPNLTELKEFCTSGHYRLCPFFVGSKKMGDKIGIRRSASDWNVFHKSLAGF